MATQFEIEIQVKQISLLLDHFAFLKTSHIKTTRRQPKKMCNISLPCSGLTLFSTNFIVVC